MASEFVSIRSFGAKELQRYTQLPTLGKLPSLRRLHCSGLENIRCIGLSFYGIDEEEDGRGRGGSGSTISGRVFPALEYLTLKGMDNLVEWKDVKEVDLFPMLRTLTIENCSQLKFQALRSLEIAECSSIDMVIPNKGQRSWLLTSLEELSIWKCNSLTSLPVEMLESCKSLRKLRVFKCSNLESFPLCFPKLQHLHLSSCPSITSLTSNNGCGTCLETMELKWCENLRELPEDLYKFQALRTLEIRGCPRINTLLIPKEGQKSLLGSPESLHISDCSGLINSMLPEMLESCASSLCSLEVYRCPNLVSFPLGSLTRLEHLALDYSLCEFDMSGFVSSSPPPLRKLELYGLPHVESLPSGLQFLTTLTELQLSNFGLEALPDWIGKFASLETLELWSCQKLQYLPSVATMRGLTKLTRLNVYDCPLLKERCTPDSGTEWPKISHIPK